MSTGFRVYRAPIEQRYRHLLRILSKIRASEMSTLNAVDFTGQEYLDDTAWRKAIKPLLWSPGSTYGIATIGCSAPATRPSLAGNGFAQAVRMGTSARTLFYLRTASCFFPAN